MKQSEKVHRCASFLANDRHLIFNLPMKEQFYPECLVSHGGHGLMYGEVKPLSVQNWVKNTACFNSSSSTIISCFILANGFSLVSSSVLVIQAVFPLQIAFADGTAVKSRGVV